MIGFDPYWGGLDYSFDTPEADGLAISYLPSIVSDGLAGQLQLGSEESVHSFMQAQFRMATENMLSQGLVANFTA